MRMRIVLAVTVLCSVVVTMSLARQQPSEQQGNHRVSKADLRARVINLQAELDFLGLEREANKAHLLGLMKGARDLEIADPNQVRTAVQIQGYFSGEDPADAEKSLKKKVDAAKAYLDRKQQDYVRLSREFADKRLELAEVEKQYNDAR